MRMGPSSPLSPFPCGPWSPLSPYTDKRANGEKLPLQLEFISLNRARFLPPLKEKRGPFGLVSFPELFAFRCTERAAVPERLTLNQMEPSSRGTNPTQREESRMA
ncbi:hypothetical protein EYF80_005811 [Liparis tanakae]|uniref:Uncharacterized protein n=1 Tax=Liparis tanakae TaxID=230148 RepID=A0A4Z2J0Z2_9TELE|nr:hypothetical protein EYF80_005811 [Liparis tanakae]